MKKYILIFFTLITGIYSCSKDDNSITSQPPPSSPNLVTDIDGNTYDTINIGTQVWMQQNLKTTHYNNGVAITNLTGNNQWSDDKIGAYCFYNNDSTNKTIYGLLYNWYSVTNPAGLCPKGWHVPSDSEWAVLINYLGGDSLAGGAMKSTSLWNMPNINATNSSGLNCFPASFRDVDGMFNYLTDETYFWSSTNANSTYAWSYNLSYKSEMVSINYYGMNCGLSIRCVKD